jgi:hypothetical protein
MVDRFLERFVLTDDMIRICVEQGDDLFYFMAIMHTRIGQSLVRRDRNGSVIDHLDATKIGSLRYPIVSAKLKVSSISSFRKAFLLREEARLSLDNLAIEFLRLVGLENYRQMLSVTKISRRFTVYRSSLIDRFDSEPSAPIYAAYRDFIGHTGFGTTIADIATVIKPPGRYKTLYVDDEEFGINLLSGRQVAQFRPIAMKAMSRRAWKRPEAYQISEGMVLMTADGRAEDNLADCAMVKSDRVGWAASGHVHRLLPKPGIDPGLLYLACSCGPVQKLLKSLSTGSVVDALSDVDVRSVPVPYPTSTEGLALGDAADKAWAKFARATEIEDAAIRALETELSPVLDN